jgi:hypothetical protein
LGFPWVRGDQTSLEQVVCHIVVAFAIYIEKYLKAKRRRIMEIQTLFHHSKNIIFQKNKKSLFKKIKILQDIEITL